MSEITTIQNAAFKLFKGMNIGRKLLKNQGKAIVLHKDGIEKIIEDDFSDALYIGSKEVKQLEKTDYVYSGDFLFALDENGKSFIIEVDFDSDFEYVASADFIVVNPNSFLKNYLKIPRYRKKLIEEIGSVKDETELLNRLKEYPINLNASMSSELELEVEDVDEKPVEVDPKVEDDKLLLADISMSQKTEALSNILKRIELNEININTKFQRSASLWEDEKKCKLIESILLNFPIPAFYFDASDEGNWLIIDGLQRLSSIKEFVIDGNLVLNDLDYLKDLEGKTYKELERPYQRKIEEFEIVAYKVLPGTPDPIKYNLFKRINSGALKLEDQEIRHALNQGLPADTLIRFSRFNEFKDVIQFSEKRVKRMEDREIVLRFLAFRLSDFKQYSGNIKTFLDRSMEKINTLTEENLDELERDFKHSLVTCQKIFGEHTFRRSIIDREDRARRFSKVIYEPWIHAVSKLSIPERNILVKNSPTVIKIFKGILRGEKNVLGYDAQHEFDAFGNNQAYTSKRLKERFESIEKIVRRWAE